MRSEAAGAQVAAVGVGLLLAAAAAAAVVLYSDIFHVKPTPLNLVALAAALVAAWLLVSRPALGIWVLVVLVYLNVSEVLVRFHGLPSMLQVLGLPLFLIGWGAQGTQRLRYTLAPTPAIAALVGYILLLWTTSVSASDAALADEKALDYLKALLVLVLVLCLTWDAPGIKRAARVLVVSGALLGGIGLIQVLTGAYDQSFAGLARIKHAQIYDNVFRPRIAGPLGDPNFFAQILVPVVALSLVMAVASEQKRERLLALACTALSAAGVIFSYSRGGVLALAVVGVLVVLMTRVPIRRAATAGAALLVFLVAVNPNGMLRRLATIQEFVPGDEQVLEPDSSFQERSLLMRSAWLMFLDHPIAGVGAGNYTTHFDDYSLRAGSTMRTYDTLGGRKYTHNAFLEIGAESGILGLALFGFALFACFRALRRSRERLLAAGDTELAAIARGLEIGLWGHLVTSLFLHAQYSRHLWLLLGLSLAVERLVTAGDHAPVRSASRAVTASPALEVV